MRNPYLSTSFFKSPRIFLLIAALSLLASCGGGGGGGGSSDTTGDSSGDSTSGVDLVVSSLNTSATVNAGDAISVDVTVRNNGSSISSFFYARIYLSSDSNIDTSHDKNQASTSITFLNPGETSSFTKTFTVPANMRSGTVYVGALVDAGDFVSESNESNNIRTSAIDVSGGVCSVDGYEENDTLSTASTLLLNTPQQHNHCDDDVDWFVFSAVANESYSLTTRTLGTEADTRVEVYDTDGITLLKGDSDSSLETNASKLSWTAPTTADYYVKVETQFGLENTGPNTEYTLKLGEATSDLVFESAGVNGSVNVVAGTTEWVILRVYNNGFTASGSFQVKALLSTDTIINDQDTVVGTFSFDDIAAGATQELFNVDIAIPKNTITGTYSLGFVIDAENIVAEYNEQNNQSDLTQMTVSAATCTLDMYEDDDSSAYATAMTFGEVQSRNFCDDEKDWISFDVVQGSSYVVQTRSQGGDPNITVYDTDAVTSLGGAGWDTCCSSGATFTFVAPNTGTAYANIASSWGNGGVDSDYTVAVYEDLPDLNVNYLSYDWQVIYPGGLIKVWPTTNNIGFEDAGASETGIYLSSDQTFDAGDTYLGSRAISGVIASSNDQGWSTVAIPDTLPAGDYYLAAVADNTNQVLEISEDNNVFVSSSIVTISASACAADAFEQDDFVQNAGLIAQGDSQARNYCDDIYDWLKIDAVQGTQYVFEATNTTASVRFELYDTDQSTELVPETSKFVHWEAPATGTYYILSTRGLGSSPGANSDYTLDVYTCDRDAYEDDSSVSPLMVTGESQVRNFCDDNVDSFTFNAVAGTTYTITTSGLGVNLDTELQLYTDTGSSVAGGWNDNEKPNVFNSKVTWTADTNGTYEMIITGKGQKGTGTEYTVTLQ